MEPSDNPLTIPDRLHRAHELVAYLTACESAERTGGWGRAKALAEMQDGRYYDALGHRSFRAWAQAHYGPSWGNANVYDYCKAGRWIRTLPDDEAAEWERFPVTVAIKCAKALTNPELKAAILERLEVGATVSQLQQYVSGQVTDEHLETQWRTITLSRVALPVYELWRRAVNMVRYVLLEQKPDVSDSEIAEAIATDVLQNCHPDFPAQWSEEMCLQRLEEIQMGKWT